MNHKTAFLLFLTLPAMAWSQQSPELTSPADKEIKTTNQSQTVSEEKEVEMQNKSEIGTPQDDSVITMRTHRTVRKITYISPRYKRIPRKYNYISHFALGMDYSSELYADNSMVNQPSIYDEYLTHSGGFNIYGMGSTRYFRNNPQIGSYVWGLGINFNQYHDGEKAYVELASNGPNNPGDSATTQLRTSSTQFYWLNRYEFQIARRIYPFVGFNVGILVNSVNQRTRPIVPLQGFEAESSDNVHNHVSAYVSPELGLRLRLSSWVSLSVSHEWRFGDNTEVGNLDKSAFNNIQYSLHTDETELQSSMWKVGLLFDLSGGKYDREKISEGYYDTAMEVQRVEPINRYRNKPCPPCPCNTTNPSSEVRINNGTGVFQGGSSSGSSSGSASPSSLPGIRSGGSSSRHRD